MVLIVVCDVWCDVVLCVGGDVCGDVCDVCEGVIGMCDG